MMHQSYAKRATRSSLRNQDQCKREGARKREETREGQTFLPGVLRVCVLFALATTAGCVQRQLTVQSNPSGAIVYLNDREMGRTPFSHKFLWYGGYDVVLRKDGYQTLKTWADVPAPIWQWVPLDAVTDFLPLKDEHVIQFDLKPDVPVDPVAMIARGQILQQQLQSTGLTVNKQVMQVHPATRPTTGPATDAVSLTPPR